MTMTNPKDNRESSMLKLAVCSSGIADSFMEE
jgi:hypothetical protein